jgi:hypothetical protein
MIFQRILGSFFAAEQGAKTKWNVTKSTESHQLGFSGHDIGGYLVTFMGGGGVLTFLSYPLA